MSLMFTLSVLVAFMVVNVKQLSGVYLSSCLSFSFFIILFWLQWRGVTYSDGVSLLQHHHCIIVHGLTPLLWGILCVPSWMMVSTNSRWLLSARGVKVSQRSQHTFRPFCPRAVTHVYSTSKPENNCEDYFTILPFNKCRQLRSRKKRLKSRKERNHSKGLSVSKEGKEAKRSAQVYNLSC